jgi:dTDP-4-amino-4,6-dideoxy-D-galactose acyltransferase
MNEYRILDWDSGFLGYKVATIDKECITLIDFNKVYNELQIQDVKLLYWPADIDCLYQGDICAENKGVLVDIKTTYELSINSPSSNQSMQLSDIEMYGNKVANDELLSIAVQCGEYSRFKIDPKITFNKFADLYRTWMIKSVQGIMSDDVIIVKGGDTIKGVITVYLEDNVGNIGLVGVDENYRGQGIGGKLIKAALSYFNKKGCGLVNVVTQGKNEAACRLYEKFGFVVKNKVNFYHFWLR